MAGWLASAAVMAGAGGAVGAAMNGDDGSESDFLANGAKAGVVRLH
jgi:hypothetical protein